MKHICLCLFILSLSGSSSGYDSVDLLADEEAQAQKNFVKDCMEDKVCLSPTFTHSHNYGVFDGTTKWIFYTISALLIVDEKRYRVQGYFLPDGQIRPLTFMDPEYPVGYRVVSVGNKGIDDRGLYEEITIAVYDQEDEIKSTRTQVIKRIDFAL